MRLIGHLPNEASASTFSDYLYVQGIANEVEAEKDGWAIWIHSEDELAKAKEMLTGFLGNPADPKFSKHSKRATQLKEQAQQEEEAAEKRYFDRKRIFRSPLPFGVGPLTLTLMAASIVVTVLLTYGIGGDWINALYISRYRSGAPEILRGEIWRLFTPIFIHANLLQGAGFLHLFFNVLWLFDLGNMIEGRLGTARLLLLVLVIAALSNFGQYYASGPLFGGMSGVVYGLLGYVWMKGRYDPASGLFLHPQTVTMMLVWFFLCLVGVIPNVANTAHGVGLGIGMAWGYLSSLRRVG
jgi:GlpG protein